MPKQTRVSFVDVRDESPELELKRHDQVTASLKQTNMRLRGNPYILYVAALPYDPQYETDHEQYNKILRMINRARRYLRQHPDEGVVVIAQSYAVSLFATFK